MVPLSASCSRSHSSAGACLDLLARSYSLVAGQTPAVPLAQMRSRWVQAWKPPLQVHSSLHSPPGNRQGPTNRPAKPAREKPSVLPTGTSPARQPEPEAPALPTGHPDAVTAARSGRMDSLNFICPSGDWNKNEKQTPGAVKLVILTTDKTGHVSIPSVLTAQLGKNLYTAHSGLGLGICVSW